MKKFLLSLLSALLSLSLLAGCAGPRQAAESPVPSQPRKEPVTLRYWSMWRAEDPQAAVILEAADSFLRETGIRVLVDFHGNDRDHLGQLRQAIDSGTQVDVFDEKLESLLPEMKPYMLSLGQMTMQYEYVKTASPELLKATRDLADGELLAIPYQPYAMVFFYNKDIFKTAGIETLPTTWEEFLEVCQMVKTAGYIPLACDDKYIPLLFGHHMGRLVGQWEQEDIIQRGLWDHSSVQRFARDYATLARRGFFSPTVDTNCWPYSQNYELATGQAAMYFTGSWLPHELIPLTGPDFEWGSFPYPILPGGKYGMDAMNYSAMGLAIHKKTTHQSEAFRFVQYLTKGTYDSRLSESSHSMPVDRANSAWPRQVAALRPVLRNIQYHWEWAAGAECAPEITPILVRNIQQLCAGLYTADEFVDAMVRDTAGIVVEVPEEES